MTTEIMGPLTEGHYVQLGMGFGFYVPEADYLQAQQRANESGRMAFLSVDKSGRPLHGSRDEILNNPESSGMIAWIVPQAVR